MHLHCRQLYYFFITKDFVNLEPNANTEIIKSIWRTLRLKIGSYKCLDPSVYSCLHPHVVFLSDTRVIKSNYRIPTIVYL